MWSRVVQLCEFLTLQALYHSQSKGWQTVPHTDQYNAAAL